MKQPDSIDKKLLTLIQEDSKLTHKQLALKLNLSVTAIYERIKRLERTGMIAGYVAVVDKKKAERGFVALCQIKLTQHVKEYLYEFEKEVVKLDEVMECYHISGEHDYLLKICVKDMESYREFMVSKLTSLKYIGSTQSSFVINEVKNTRVLHFLE